MAVLMTPERWPVLGRTPALSRRRFGLPQRLRGRGDLVLLSAKFRKGVMFDSFRPFGGNGLVNSAVLNESWRPGPTTRPNAPVLPVAWADRMVGR